jgi:hypothetical protein
MKKVKVVLENSFHNSRVTVVSTEEIEDDDGLGIWDYLQYKALDGDKNAKRRLRKIKNALCGSKDCCCGVVR